MLHVLTGSVKGRKLKVPRGRQIRPTTSRVKKSIFDTLGDINGVLVLDLFAGSGGLGIESLSRGARHVTFVEKDPGVFSILKENVAACGFIDHATLIRINYLDAVKRLWADNEKFELIFIDPPYKLYKEMEVGDFIADASGVLAADGVIVIEHDYRLDREIEGFTRDTRRFGGTDVSYFRRGDGG